MATGTWNVLQDKRGQLLDKIDAITDYAKAEGRGLTDEEHGKAASYLAEVEKIDRDLDLEEKVKLAAASLRAAVAPYVTGIHDRSADRPWGYDTFKCSLDEFVTRYPRTTLLPPDHPKHPMTIYRNAAFGEFLLKVRAAALGHGTDTRLNFEAAATGAGEFIGADGGFLVPTIAGDEIVLRMYGGEILSRVRQRSLGSASTVEINMVNESSRATGSRHGGVQAYWIDEGTAPTATRPKFAKQRWQVNKLGALGYATDELLADASLIGGVMFDAFVDELKFFAEDSIINGTGTGMCVGILNAGCTVSQAKETGQVAATVLTENLSKMWARLHPRSRAGAVWLSNQDCEPQLDTLSKTIGTAGVEPYFVSYSSDGVLRIKGAPVIAVEYCATVGTVGDIILANLGEYWVFDKGAPQTASSIHVQFITDQMCFRAIYRIDGKPAWMSALTPFKGSNTQSPFVTLATRA